MRLASLTLVVCAAATALADEKAIGEIRPEARAHLEAGLRFYGAQQFDEAIAEVSAAQELDPHPEFLYTLGQIARRQGRCPKALQYYGQYLDQSSDVAGARAVERLIELCEPAKPKAPPPAPTPAAMATALPPVSLPPPRVARRSWYEDWIGDALVGGGLVASAAAIGLLVDAKNKSDAAASSYAAFGRAADSVPGERAGGTVALGVATFLVGGGIVHYLAHRRGR